MGGGGGGLLFEFLRTVRVALTEQAAHAVDDAHRLAVAVVGNPDALVHVLDRKVERDDLVVDEQLHPGVVLQQRHQLAVCSKRRVDDCANTQSSHSNFQKEKKKKKAKKKHFLKKKITLFKEKKHFLWGFLSYILV